MWNPTVEEITSSEMSTNMFTIAIALDWSIFFFIKNRHTCIRVSHNKLTMTKPQRNVAYMFEVFLWNVELCEVNRYCFSLDTKSNNKIGNSATWIWIWGYLTMRMRYWALCSVSSRWKLLCMYTRSSRAFFFFLSFFRSEVG